jgi:hypothetical protein
MFWKLFGSERRVQEALEQSVGYDISPNVLRFPANVETPPAEAASRFSLQRRKTA